MYLVPNELHNVVKHTGGVATYRHATGDVLSYGTSWPSMESRGPSVTEADVAAFEEQLGYSLPEVYRRFLLEVNGGSLALENTALSFTSINTLLSLNDPTEGVDLLSYVRDHRRLSLLPSKDLLCVGFDDGGGRILLALAGELRGSVWFENTADPRPEDANPRVEWFKRRDMKKLADSFEQFLGLLRPLPPPPDQ